jgi:hypothetical protein
VERAAHNYDCNHDALIDDAEAAIAVGKEVDEGPGEKVVIHNIFSYQAALLSQHCRP